MIPTKIAVYGYNMLSETRIGRSFLESFGWLTKFIEEINYPLPAEYYINGVALTSILSFIISFPLLVTLHLVVFGRPLFFSIVLGLLSSLIIFLLVMTLSIYYPVFKAKSIRVVLDKKAPFTLLIMTSLAASGVSVYSIIEKTLKLVRDEYTRSCFERIIRRTTEGVDASEALYIESLTTSSYVLSEVFEGLASLSQTGVGVVGFLEKSLHDCIDQLESRLREVIEKLSVITETYVIIALVLPLLLMITTLFLGGLGGLPLPPKAMLILISFVLVPFMFFILLMMADSMVSSVEV